MPRRRGKASTREVARSEDWLFPNISTQSEVEIQSSLLDVVDNVLNKGMVLNGDLILGVANVDLIYAKLSVLLAALDKIVGEPLHRDTSTPPRRPPKTAARKRRPRRK